MGTCPFGFPNDKTGCGGVPQTGFRCALLCWPSVSRVRVRRLGASAGEDGLWNVLPLQAVGGELSVRKPRERLEPVRLCPCILETGEERAKDGAEPMQEVRGFVEEV